ncbi:MAG: Hsp20/alpha crystallin family protein [Ignavibacteria bacterium]|nr:Hsp20/alpha crystallin family protein [Ignavibacteria bacterium]
MNNEQKINAENGFDWETLIETEPTVPPIIDIIESKNDFQIKVYMPGVQKENIYLKLDDEVLSVFGKMDLNHADEVRFILREKNYGHYFRKFFITDKIDSTQISAKLDNGLLNIILPKHDRIKPKEISIN